MGLLGDVVEDSKAASLLGDEYIEDHSISDLGKNTPLEVTANTIQRIKNKPIPKEGIADSLLGTLVEAPLSVSSGLMTSVVGMLPTSGRVIRSRLPKTVNLPIVGDVNINPYEKPLSLAESEQMQEPINKTTTYQPTTESGKYVTDVVNAAFEPVFGTLRQALDSKTFKGMVDPSIKMVGGDPEIFHSIVRPSTELSVGGKMMNKAQGAVGDIATLPKRGIEKITTKNIAETNKLKTDIALEEAQSNNPEIAAQGQAKLAAMKESGATPSAILGEEVTPTVTPWRTPSSEGEKALKEVAESKANSIRQRRADIKAALDRNRAAQDNITVDNVAVEPSEQLSPKNVDSVPVVSPYVPKAEPGAPAIYRGHRYTIEGIDADTGRIKLLGREKTIDGKYARLLPEEPADLAAMSKDFGLLQKAGYTEAELANMKHSEMRDILDKRNETAAAPPSLEVLNSQKLIHENILKYQREKALADIQLLKDNGWTDDMIAGRQEYQLRSAASDIRNGKTPEMPEVLKSQEVKTILDDFDKVYEPLKDKKVEELTPEEMDALSRTIAETNDTAAVLHDFGPELAKWQDVIENGLTDADLAALDNAELTRAIDVAAKTGDPSAVLQKAEMDLLREGELQKHGDIGRLNLIKQRAVELAKKKEPVVKKKSAIRREGPVEVQKVAEWTKEMQDAKDAQEGQAETHRPGRRGYKDVEEQSLDDLMRDDADIPQELSFLKKENFDNLKKLLDKDPITTFERLQKNGDENLILSYLENLSKSDKSGVLVDVIKDIIARQKSYSNAFTMSLDSRTPSIADSRLMTVRAYKYMPSVFDKFYTKESYLRDIRGIEEKASINDNVHRTGPNVMEAIDRYYKEGKLTDEQASWMRGVVNGLKGKAKFDLIILEEDLSLFHSTKDVNLDKINFDAFFGNKSFYNDFKGSFGDYTHEIKLPSQIKNRLLDLDNKNSIDALSTIIRDAYPNDPNISKYIDLIRNGDKESLRKFYEVWTDKNLILPYIKEKGYSGAKFGDEYILTKESLNDIYSNKYKSADGYYNFVNNLMMIKDKTSFLHETSHFAFHNVLSGKDRIQFVESLVKDFYNEKGELNRGKLAEHLQTDNLFEMIDPAEIFAKEMQNYVLRGAKQSWYTALYNKVKTFIRSMLDEALSSGKIPFEREQLYKQIMSDMVDVPIQETYRPGQRRIVVPIEKADINEKYTGPPKPVSVDSQLDFLGLSKGYDMLSDLYRKLKAKEANPIEIISRELGRGAEDADRINIGMPPRKNAKGELVPAKEPAADTSKYADWLTHQSIGEPTYPGQKQSLVKRALGYKAWADGTPAEKTVFDLNKGELAKGFHHANNIIGLREVQQFLYKHDIKEEALTKYMREGGEATPEMVQAAGKVRDWLDYMRDRYQDFLKGQYARHLSPKQAGALYDLINGADLVAVTKKYKLKDADVVKDIFDKYNEINDWGLDDYIPKVELGSYRILSPEGTVVAVALSKKHAVEKIMELIDDYPEYKGNFYIDNTSRSTITEQLTGVGSRKGYYAIVNKLAKAIESEVEGIDSNLAKKMAERSVKKQFSVQPKDKYSEFAEEREEYLRGEENMFPVLAKYSRVMETKMALDPVIHDYKKGVRDTLGPNLRNQVDTLIDDVKGRYWGADEVVDKFLRKGYDYITDRGIDIGAPPIMTVSNLLGRGREVQANLKLGWRPVNAAVNLVSGQGHVWAKVGTPYIIDAYKFKGTPEGKQLLAELGPYMGMSFAEEGVGTGKFSTKRAGETSGWTYGKPLGLFQAAELPNREIGLLANYLMAKKEFGLSDAAARETAIRANWFQNFTYNIANMPRGFRGPIGKTISQFKPYLVKELEFVSSLRAEELVRYMSMQMTLGGPRAAMYMIKSLPIIGAVAGVDELERLLNTYIPRLSRGVPGLLGADVSAMSSVQLPNTMPEWAGPMVSDAINTFKIMQGFTEKDSLSVANELAMNSAPFWRNWNDIWNNSITGEGDVRDPVSRKIASNQSLYLSTDDYYKKLLNTAGYTTKRFIGAQDIGVSTARVEQSIVKREERREGDALKTIKDSIAKKGALGETVPDWMYERMDELKEKTGNFDRFNRGLREKEKDFFLTPAEQGEKRKNRILRGRREAFSPELD